MNNTIHLSSDRPSLFSSYKSGATLRRSTIPISADKTIMMTIFIILLCFLQKLSW